MDAREFDEGRRKNIVIICNILVPPGPILAEIHPPGAQNLH